jgi:hypothetical protein
LKVILKVEWHFLSMVPVVSLLAFISLPTSLVMVAFFAATMALIAFSFQFVATQIFLRPITRALNNSGGVTSAAHERMRKVHWMTLVGSMLSSASSIMLYSNILAASVDILIMKHLWWNPHVFVMNLDTALGTIGMMFAMEAIVDSTRFSFSRMPFLQLTKPKKTQVVVPVEKLLKSPPNSGAFPSPGESLEEPLAGPVVLSGEPLVSSSAYRKVVAPPTPFASLASGIE